MMNSDAAGLRSVRRVARLRVERRGARLAVRRTRMSPSNEQVHARPAADQLRAVRQLTHAAPAGATATSSFIPRVRRRAPRSSGPRIRPTATSASSCHRDGKPFVFEAIATVRYTPLADVDRARRRRPLRGEAAAASSRPSRLAKLREAARTFEGKPYDLYFEWSDERIYCSELVWKMYQQALGVQLGDAAEAARVRSDRCRR